MEQKGLLGSLFDLSFTEFVTTRVIKALFVLAIVMGTVGAFGLLISGIGKGGGMAFLSILLAPIAFFLYVLMARIWLEVIIVLFRIAENTGRLVEQGEKSAGATAAD